MQFSRIDTDLPPPPPYSTWTQKICYWLGRLWSICFSPCDLTHRVTQAVGEQFMKDDSLAESKPSTPIPPKKGKIIEDDERLLALKLSIPEKPPMTPNEIKATEQEAKVENQLKITPTLQQGEKTEDPVSPKKEEPLKADVGSIKITLKRRPKTKKAEEKDKQTAVTAVVVPQTSPSESKQTSLDVKIIEVDGDGACQLSAILKGLELQYSDKLKYQENGKTMTLTPEKLRQWGVDFICQQIDSSGPHAQKVLEFLDSDRKEYNASVEEKFTKNKQAFLKNIQEEFKKQKITKAKGITRIKEYNQKCAKNKAEELSPDDADFINKRLNNPKFACSTSHLFALSTLLDLPIYVHDEEKIRNNQKRHGTQMIIPERCTQEPIHLLYQPKRVHYQYIHFPKSVKDLENLQELLRKNLIR